MAQQASRKPVFPPEIAPYIDVGAYLVDSRAAAATLYLDPLLKGKELILLTRSKQSDGQVTRRWKAFFEDCGYHTIAIDSISGDGLEEVLDYLAKLLQRKLKVAKKLGINNATLRVVALGVPNVGKSTFLNRLIGQKRLKTGDIPGITRGRQWVRLFDDVEVLDTAGVLRDPEQINRRKPYWMLLNLMPYDFKLREETVDLLRNTLNKQAWLKLRRYYKMPDEIPAPQDWFEMLEIVGRYGGYTLKNDDLVDKAARRLMKDFRMGRFGRISLEVPETAVITSPFLKRPGAEEQE
ncbi:MAG: 50S ribosome-binding GTPase [Planctomycetales bacterium]|nr:50S ribosome-binding GTPase [bacterium]UNM07212.1 MAG: 50S ribosome-binding GTPase [Planctomycetales bacterium]